ncbi:zinc finger BED domain-containing protein 4-like [Episyrphus balteatus]|uniref:zinc finger BED domain-containing protein 4-like n=1 Tax=Episyrphus balteatus TaxID=286459 RepID=UPI0024868568|nr:zinc finger BED domain-containing protein 4-like [Episyrphus balteatus]
MCFLSILVTISVRRKSCAMIVSCIPCLTLDDIGRKVLVVESDNAANIKAAILTELQLTAHTINLFAKDGLKDGNATTIFNKVKSIVAHFKRRAIETAKLLGYQKSQSVANPRKLLQNVPTRWNSTFYMLERFVALEEAVKSTMALCEMDSSIYLTSDEWVVVRELCQVLKSLEARRSDEIYFGGKIFDSVARYPPSKWNCSGVQGILEKAIQHMRKCCNRELVKQRVIYLVADKFAVRNINNASEVLASTEAAAPNATARECQGDGDV